MSGADDGWRSPVFWLAVAWFVSLFFYWAGEQPADALPCHWRAMRCRPDALCELRWRGAWALPRCEQVERALPRGHPPTRGSKDLCAAAVRSAASWDSWDWLTVAAVAAAGVYLWKALRLGTLGNGAHNELAGDLNDWLADNTQRPTVAPPAGWLSGAAPAGGNLAEADQPAVPLGATPGAVPQRRDRAWM